MDDILLQSKTFPEMVEKIRVLLEDCLWYGLYLAPRKVNVAQAVKFAGMRIDYKGCKPDRGAGERVCQNEEQGGKPHQPSSMT